MRLYLFACLGHGTLVWATPDTPGDKDSGAGVYEGGKGRRVEK